MKKELLDVEDITAINLNCFQNKDNSQKSTSYMLEFFREEYLNQSSIKVKCPIHQKQFQEVLGELGFKLLGDAGSFGNVYEAKLENDVMILIYCYADTNEIVVKYLNIKSRVKMKPNKIYPYKMKDQQLMDFFCGILQKRKNPKINQMTTKTLI